MIHVGTSGYNYPEWRGSFYPAEMPATEMLAYYSARFDTVEINYTFYRLPSEEVLADRARGTPDKPRCAVKEKVEAGEIDEGAYRRYVRLARRGMVS
ncbi:MAG: DUF72 domain-containing protein [Chloroflexi bacterium]|nr:DUF72 domain-containing protein [Chloroflexota bacterium]